jgi:catechol-2,3-dioxygenase
MTAIKSLGEIAFRTERLDEMCEFYGEVLGLERIDDYADAAFFEIAESHAGHTQVLVLFDRSGGADYMRPDPARTTVDHIAFAIDLADFDAEAKRLESQGYDLDFAYHDWVEWRSLYLDDPDGNRVELVCYDPKEV